MGIEEAGGSGTGVSTWADQSGNASDFSQSNALLRMAFSAAGGPDGRACVTNGGTGWLLSSWSNQAPGTVPLFLWMIVRNNIFVANSNLCAGQANTRLSIRNGTSPNSTFNNGTASSPITMTAGTWNRVQARLSNSAVTDYYRVGASSTGTGASFGNNAASGGWAIGAQNSGAAISNSAFAEILVTNGLPTELATLELYGQALYPGVAF